MTSVYEQVVAATPIVRLSAVVDGAWQTAPRCRRCWCRSTRVAFCADVVHLVGDAAGGEVERERVGVAAARIRPAIRSSASSHDTRVKPALARPPHHRVRQPAEVAELGAVERAQRLDVGEHRRVERRPSCSSRSRFRRVVQRWTPESVQSWKPATPSAQPSHTPLRRIRHAYGRWRRFVQTTFAMSR